MAGVVGIFTADSRAKILAQGGSGWWTMRVGKEEGLDYAVLFRKRIAHQEDTHDVPHGLPFGIGKIENIKRDGRVFFVFSEIAWIDGLFPLKWSGQQFPLSYQIDLETLGFEPSKLNWIPVGSSQKDEAPKDKNPESDMGVFERHKLMISQETGIPVERLIIDVR